MSAEYVAIRRCVDCRAEYTVKGWQLSGLCPLCKAKEDAKVCRNCTSCGRAIEPAPNRHMCDACFSAEHTAAIERYGSE